MTGNLQAIGYLLTWVLGWAIGGSFLDAGFLSTSLPFLDNTALGSTLLVLLWSLLWGGGGFWLYQRWTRPSLPGE